MKVFFIGLLSLLSLNPSFAKEVKSEKTVSASQAHQQLGNEIRQLIDFPKVILPSMDSLNATLYFWVSEDYTLEIDRIECANPEVEEYLWKTLQGISLDTYALNAGHRFGLRIRFE